MADEIKGIRYARILRINKIFRTMESFVEKVRFRGKNLIIKINSGEGPKALGDGAANFRIKNKRLDEMSA